MNDVRRLTCPKTSHMACLRLLNSIITDALEPLFIVLLKEYLSYAAFLLSGFSPLSSTLASLLTLDPHTQHIFLKSIHQSIALREGRSLRGHQATKPPSDPWVAPHLCLRGCLLSCFQLRGTHLFYFLTDFLFYCNLLSICSTLSAAIRV